MADADPALRWVVLRHEGIPDPHYDLMIEFGHDLPLTTYRLDTWPMTHQTTSTRLPDHRREYLQYEGPISGGRGHVRRVAGGTYRFGMSDSGDVLWLRPGHITLSIPIDGNHLNLSA